MRIFSYLLLGILSVKMAFGQTVNLTGNFNQFVSYYLTTVDINTGESFVQLFEYRIECVNDCPPDADGDNRWDTPIPVNVSFKISIKSPALGIDEEETIALLETEEPFEMYAPIHLDNRDFTIETLDLYDENGDAIPITIDIVEQLEEETLESMFGTIVQTGRLPDGIYRFELTLTVEGGVGDFKEEVVNVITPSVLLLIGPGGTFDELEQNQVFTNYPVLQWESETFSSAVIETSERLGKNWGFYVRVAEFRCEDHATIEDAIEDLTALPLDQALGWEFVENQIQFQYPTSGAVDLEAGGMYVWQVMKRLPTTSGTEELFSPIYIFQIKDLSTDPMMQSIQEILPEDLYSNFFNPCGPLTGYTSNGVFKLDGEDADITTLNELVEAINLGNRSLLTTEIR